ncbi:MAG: MFS transporter [Actinomycetota bacterium]|nr:MFS transporter [Actinomycetota bacterium]
MTAAAVTGRRVPVALRPLQHRRFATVWAAALVSTVGTWMETVAVADLTAHQTGGATWAALVAGAGFLPMALLGPVGGAMADRVGPARLLIRTTVLQALLGGALSIAAVSGHASPSVVILIVFVAGAAAGIGMPAATSLTPRLVPRDELLAATSLAHAQFNLGRVVGPALAGLAVAAVSHTAVFVLNTASFVVLLVALRCAVTDDEVDGGAVSTEQPFWGQLAAGVRAIRGDAQLTSAVTLIGIVAVTASPFIALVPAMARLQHGGSTGLTVALVTAQGLGAVVATLAAPAIGARAGVGSLVGTSVAVLPLTLMAYGVAPNAMVAVVAIAFVGASYVCVLTGLTTVVQLHAPAPMRSTVTGLFFVVLGLIYPVAAAMHGMLADVVSVAGVTVGGGVALAVGLLALATAAPHRLVAVGIPHRIPSLADLALPSRASFLLRLVRATDPAFACSLGRTFIRGAGWRASSAARRSRATRCSRPHRRRARRSLSRRRRPARAIPVRGRPRRSPRT